MRDNHKLLSGELNARLFLASRCRAAAAHTLTARLYLSASATRGRMVHVVTRLEGERPQVGSSGCIRHSATFHASTSLWCSTWQGGGHVW